MRCKLLKDWMFRGRLIKAGRTVTVDYATYLVLVAGGYTEPKGGAVAPKPKPANTAPEPEPADMEETQEPDTDEPDADEPEPNMWKVLDVFNRTK